jgi:hypothetical protein
MVQGVSLPKTTLIFTIYAFLYLDQAMVPVVRQKEVVMGLVAHQREVAMVPVELQKEAVMDRVEIKKVHNFFHA